MSDINEDVKYSKAWCNKYPHGAWERINELEKQLAKKEKVIKGQALYCKQKHDQVEKLEKQLAESVPKSAVKDILHKKQSSISGEFFVRVDKFKELLTNHKE